MIWRQGAPIAEIGLCDLLRESAPAGKVFVVVEEVVAALAPGACVDAGVCARFWGCGLAEGTGEGGWDVVAGGEGERVLRD